MNINLANGYKDIIAVTLHNPLEGVVIVRTGTKFGNSDECVVWAIHRESLDTDFDAYWGHYTTNMKDAAENYANRGGGNFTVKW